MRFFLCLFYMFHRRYSNCRPLNSARYNRIICQTVENTSFLRGCRAYCTRWRKVTKVTNPISDFTFLSTAKSGKSRIKNPFLDSLKGTHPKKSKSGFHGFRFYRPIGKSEKGFAKLFSWTAAFLLLIMRARARPPFLRTVFQILLRISQSNGKNRYLSVEIRFGISRSIANPKSRF